MRSRNLSEIQFKKSFLKFSVFFFLSLIVGLVGRYFIYSQPLDQLVSEKISKNDDYKIDVQGIRIKLRQGWMPAFAVFAEKIVAIDNKCLSRSLVAENIFVSLSISSLLKSEIKPKKVYVAGAHLKTPEKCKSSEKNVAVIKNKPSEQVPFSMAKKESSQLLPGKIFSEFKEKNKLVMTTYFNIENFKIDLYRAGEIELAVRGGMNFHHFDSEFIAEISPKVIEFRGQELPISKGSVSLSLSQEELTAHYQASIREGKIEINAKLSNQENYPIELSSKATKIPSSSFSRFFLAETQLNYLWINCEASLKSTWEKLRKAPFSLDGCNISGPYGTAKILQSETSFEKLKLVEIEFNKIDLDQVIKNKRPVYFSGIFSKFGTFSGHLKHSEGRWKLKALLENADVLFSRNNLRELQKISSLPFQISNSDSGWFLRASGVKIADGTMKGSVDLAVDKMLKNGRGKIALHQIRLQPKIYKLMLRSETADFSLFGKVAVANGKVSSWDGALTSSRIAGEKFAFNDLKIEASQKENRPPQVKIVSKDGEFYKESEVLSWLKPTALENQWMGEQAEFSELSVRFDVREKENWDWKRGYMRFNNGWQLSSEGRLKSSGNIVGWLQWDIPEKPYMKWKYSGTFKKGKWKPEEDWMKTWLQSNANYLSKNPTIDFVADNQSEMVDDVKSMGEKLLEKAKSVLPLENKDKNKGS